MYGGQTMSTITIRVTDDEKARIDELAAAMTSAENKGGRWWGQKRGRGDVVRLALTLLEHKLAGTNGVTDTGTPFEKAEAGLYRGSGSKAVGDRVAELVDELGVTRAPAPKRKKVPA